MTPSERGFCQENQPIRVLIDMRASVFPALLGSFACALSACPLPAPPLLPQLAPLRLSEAAALRGPFAPNLAAAAEPVTLTRRRWSPPVAMNMPIARPNPNVDYKLQIAKPDPSIDYKMMIKRPQGAIGGTDRPLTPRPFDALRRDQSANDRESRGAR